MKKKQISILSALCLLILLMSSLGLSAFGRSAGDLSEKMRQGHYVQKVEHFMIILDASDTMNAPFAAGSRWQTARKLVSMLNQTIPDMPITGFLRIFSDVDNYSGSEPTTLLYSGQSRQAFEESLKKIKAARGNSPLAQAINAGSRDLKAVGGEIAVIILTDGASIPHGPVLKGTADMKRQHGDRLCVYPILVGGDAGGRDLLRSISQTGQCGFFSDASEIASPDGMTRFVERVFLTARYDSDGDGVADDKDQCPNTPKGTAVNSKGCPLIRDSDGDGVPDERDQCPNTSKGIAVDTKGCPLPQDSDGDGVLNPSDYCPNTPKGAKVDERGCWAFTGSMLFAFDDSELRGMIVPALDNAVEVLRQNPDLRVEIQGHTCNIGSEAYNTRLSSKRALSVFNYLSGRGIKKSRLIVKGYGSTRPAYSNETEAGRIKNRRVEFAPVQ
jgi:OOP family OmpA-OmpF porin